MSPRLSKLASSDIKMWFEKAHYAFLLAKVKSSKIQTMEKTFKNVLGNNALMHYLNISSKYKVGIF